MEVWEALVLGLLQGLTEFLPVSSSGHLVIAQRLMGINSGDVTFEVMVHAATVLATITVFWNEIAVLMKGGLKFKYNAETRYLLKIGISMIPVLIVGLFFKDFVRGIFSETIGFVGCMLLVTAALLALTHFLRPGKTHPVSYRDAFAIGLVQAAAVIPGISRSGSTIATGLLLGGDRDQVAKFSFLMVLVPILGEAFLEIIDTPVSLLDNGLPLLVGFIAAYVSGLFACRVMIRIVSRGKLYWFAIYCAAAGITAIMLN